MGWEMVAGRSWAPMSSRLHEEQLVHQQQRLHRRRQHCAQRLERCQPPPRRRHGTVLPTALPTRALLTRALLTSPLPTRPLLTRPCQPAPS